MRRLVWLVAACSVALACQRHETPQQLTTDSVDAGPRTGGRLIRRLEADAHTLNYAMQGTDDERQLLQYIYDPLIDFNEKLEPIPGTAAKWEIADGGRTYILHIDPRAVFSDGKPVTANDVIFTLEKFIDEESKQFAAWFDGLDREQTKAIDDKTARIVFKQPRVTQVYAFNIGVMPQHIYGKGDFQKNPAVIGNGPYVLRRREPGNSFLLERNPHYWREKPHIDSILFRIVADETVAWNALKKGEVDVTRINNDLWWRLKDDPEVTRRVEFHKFYDLSYNCVPWNLRDPLFSDARVRRALAKAFDRQMVIDRIYHGHARAISGPFTPDSWAYNDDVHPIDFNLQGATALLSSAGWSDSDNDGVLDRNGKKFDFVMLIPAGNRSSVDQAQIYQDALRRIGIQMDIVILESATVYHRVLDGNFQAALMSWVTDPDPDPYSLFHSSQIPPNGLNVGHYSNAEVDQLLEKARITFDPAQRRDIYHQLHEILATEQPYLWTMQVGIKWAVDTRVQNVRTAKGLGLFLWNPGPFGWWLQEAR